MSVPATPHDHRHAYGRAAVGTLMALTGLVLLAVLLEAWLPALLEPVLVALGW